MHANSFGQTSEIHMEISSVFFLLFKSISYQVDN